MRGCVYITIARDRARVENVSPRMCYIHNIHTGISYINIVLYSLLYKTNAINCTVYIVAPLYGLCGVVSFGCVEFFGNSGCPRTMMMTYDTITQ